MVRSKRKHQTLHLATKKHFLFQGLLHPYPRPTSDLQGAENIIRIRQRLQRRRHITVRRGAEVVRGRVDRLFLFREKQGLVSDSTKYSIAWHLECTHCQTRTAGLRDLLLKKLLYPSQCVHVASRRYDDESMV